MKNTLVCLIALIFPAYVYGDERIVIESYREERDWPAIEKIVNEYPMSLKYESWGKPAGTTIGYLKKSDFKTDVIRVDGSTVGFVNYRMRKHYRAKFFVLRWGYINMLGIDKAHHHKGYGTALIKHVKREFEKHNIPILRLTAWDENIPACALYDKEGFVVLEKTQEKYGLQRLYEYTLPMPAYCWPLGNMLHRHPKKFSAATSVISFIMFCTLQLTLKKTNCFSCFKLQ